MSAERGRARGELSRRIWTRLTEVGLSHVQLAAAAHISIAAVDDALNPMKAPPSADILNQVAAALGITGPALIGWGTLRHRADAARLPDSPHLFGYLYAARRAACERPYPAAVPGAIPSLPMIYVSQSVYPHSEAWTLGPLPRRTGQLVAHETILGQERDCFVLGQPGSGKSILLRAALAAMADRWLVGSENTAVPVLVPAICLASENLALHEALAAAASTGLSDMGLPDPLPADFFQFEPLPGIPWLLLVDGLDDIVDLRTQLQVRNTIIANARDTVSPYRFVVATRSLKSFAFGQSWSAYWLRPFAPEDLPGFAERWFTALDSPSPGDMAHSFTDALEQAHLTELARTPMVATMLCQLYAAAPNKQLPSGRSEIYLRFTELLHERQHETGIGAETCIALQRHGESVLRQAQHTYDHLRPLLASLAVQRRAGNTDKILDMLAKQSGSACPEHVPQRLWNQFLSETLNQSGIMAAYANDFIFLHQTFIDYLAAVDTATDRVASTQQFVKIFNHRWSKSRSGRGQVWNPPNDDDSFLGFLLDVWRDTPADPARVLRRIAARGGPGCRFITAQAHLGTRLPVSIVTAAADALARSAENPAKPYWERREATAALIAIGDTRSSGLLTAMADDPDSRRDRLWAAGSLAVFGESHGRDVLIAMADRGSANRFLFDRVWVLHQVVRLGDTNAVDRIAVVATDPAEHVRWRTRAAEALTELGDPRGASALAAMASDTDLDGHQRRQAAKSLAAMGDPRGPDTLTAMAADRSLDGSWRRRAARALVELGDPRGPAILAEMTTDPDLDYPWRRRAAETLAAFGDRRGAKALASMATNSGLEDSWRRRAATALTELNGSKGSMPD